MQIEDWLYNGAPEPKDPIVQEIIRSYGGWERLGMTNYNDLKFLLRDIEARFDAIAHSNGRHNYLPDKTTSTRTAPPLTSRHLLPLSDSVEKCLDTLAR